MAKNNKRKFDTTFDEDNVHFGKKIHGTRSQSRSREKSLSNKVAQETVTEATTDKTQKGVKSKCKKTSSEVNKRKSSISDGNNNAVPVKEFSNFVRRKSTSAKLGKLKYKVQTQMTSRRSSKKDSHNVKNFVPKNNDGIILDVDDSEFNEVDGQEEDSEPEDTSTCEEQIDQNVVLGATASTMDSETDDDGQSAAKKLLLQHPDLKNLVNQMLDDRMVEFKQSLAKEKETKNGNAGKVHIGKNKTDEIVTPYRVNNRIVQKSPSDTTLYRPIFTREANMTQVMPGTAAVINQTQAIASSARDTFDNMIQERETEPEPREITQFDSDKEEVFRETGTNDKHKSLMEKISDFVENLRMEADEQLPSTSGYRASEVTVPGKLDAKKKADRTILEAERFKATINTPPGKMTCSEYNSNNDEVDSSMRDNTERRSKSDDDFFHLTCHVDPTLVAKIEKGEFVDLERLLPKDRFGIRTNTSEQRMEWVKSEEGTFLVPTSDKSARINSFKKWEQAFRVYATIYCGANPNRAKEIWQYVSIINTAASSFVWDNVANYDYTFRQLMAFNPDRSWAITYHHMWSLSMKDPLQRNHVPRQVNYYGGHQEKSNFKGSGNNNNNNAKKWTKTPDYCWSFNKGQFCKYGKNCKFIERCSYCDKASHGVYMCPKVEGKPLVGNSPVKHKHSHNSKGASK